MDPDGAHAGALPSLDPRGRVFYDHAHPRRNPEPLGRTVGEMDNNVDPASTYQVVNQLIKHDFFARHFLGVKPPEWKAIEDALTKTTKPTDAF